MDREESADACISLHAAWMAVGRQLSTVPDATTVAGSDALEFDAFKPGGPPNVGHAPGQAAGLYVDAIGQHVLTFALLARSGHMTVSPWPIVRAALELAGRVAWLLDPDLKEDAGRKRVARFYLELIASLQRDRYTVGKYNRALAKKIKSERDAKLAEARTVFDDVAIEFSSMEDIGEWSLDGEPLLGLGAAVDLFANLRAMQMSGLYDHLSDHSHPSLTSIMRLTTSEDDGKAATRPWRIDNDVVEEQARVVCLVFYKSCSLLVEHFGLDGSSLEDWADTVPNTWFKDE